MTADGFSSNPAVMTMPSNIAEDDLLILILGVRAGDISATLTGWTSFASSAGNLTHLRCFWRKAGTSEASTVSVDFDTNGQWAGGIFRFSGTADPDTTPPEAETDYLDSDSATITPVNLTPSGLSGAQDYTWIASFFTRGGNTVEDYPDGYSNNTFIEDGSALQAFSNLNDNASSETPDTFTADTSDPSDWSVVTISVPPADAGGGYPYHSIDQRRKYKHILAR